MGSQGTSILGCRQQDTCNAGRVALIMIGWSLVLLFWTVLLLYASNEVQVVQFIQWQANERRMKEVVSGTGAPSTLAAATSPQPGATVIQPHELPVELEDMPIPGRCSEEQRKVQHAEWLEDDTAVDVGGKGRRVGLLFMGLTRSMPYTLHHIEMNVFQTLRDAGYRPTVFLHTYKDSNTDAMSRAEEEAVEDWRALMPFKHSVTNQAAVLEKHKEPLEACMNLNWTTTEELKSPPKDLWLGHRHNNTKNWLCQLQSFDEVARLWEEHYKANPDEYAAVAFLRPDVLYLDPFPVSLIPQLKPDEIHVPAWANNGGMNDRFAMFHPQTAGKWKHRLEYTLTHCLERQIHSESFTKDFALHENLAIKGIREPRFESRFAFFRVRGVGEVAINDRVVPGYEEAQRVVAKQAEKLKNSDCW